MQITITEQQIANDFARELEEQIMKALGFTEQVEMPPPLSYQSLKNAIDKFKAKFPPTPRIIYIPRIRLKFLKKKRFGNDKCFKLRAKFIKSNKLKHHDKAIFIKNENVIVAPEYFKSKMELPV